MRGRRDLGAAGGLQATLSRARRDALRSAARRPSFDLYGAAGEPDQDQADALPGAGARRVFLSYAHADARRVRGLVKWLCGRGFIVTSDQDFLAGDDFAASIRAAIAAAHAVVVVWSPASARSPFVRDEAMLARKADKLVSVHVPGFDCEHLPLGLGQVHTVPMGEERAILKSLARFAG